MTFNRKVWLDWKTRKPCPTCNVGILNIPPDNRIIQTETQKSKERCSYGDNHYSDYLFSMHLICNSCKDSAIVIGSVSEENYPINEDNGIQKHVTPVAFYPAPTIIHIPESCPKSVTKLLLDSFGLYWTDVSACANKIRVAIEVLLNELNIPSNKPLHSRLEEFKKVNHGVASFLIAIKWIGNAGSHFSGLTKEDALDAYEMLEFALEKLYNDREKKLIELSNEINSTKKPRKKP